VCSPLRRVWKVEGCGLDGFEGQVDTGDLVFGAAEGPEDEQVLLGFGEDDPLAAAGFYEGTDGVDYPVAPSGVRTFSSGK
jgi:hypothetical protein